MQYLVLSLVFSLFTSFAHAEEDTKREAIKLLMQKSGIERQVNQVPKQMMQSIQQKASASASKGPSPVFNALAEATEHAYKVERIKNQISDTLYADLTSNEIVEILGWYASEVGQKITQHEIATSEKATTPAGTADIEAFMSRLEMVPAKKARLAMMTRLDNAVHATDFLIDTTLNTTVAFMKAMEKTMPTQQELSIEKELEKQRVVLKPLMAENIAKMFLFTYRNISDQELAAYIQFCESPAGKKFYQSSFTALKNTLSDANHQLAEHFASKLGIGATVVPVPNTVR